MNQLQDEEIIRLLQSGDPEQQNEAIRYFYQSFFGLIESLVVTNSGTKNDVPDIFQEGLFALVKNIRKGSFKMQSKLRTYFYKICQNLWLDNLRKGKREHH